MSPWNFWYHVTSNTKSTWLLGDPRGSRTRHHRQHIEGDYRNPPPHGTFDELHQRSKSLLETPPVVLTFEQRLIVCEKFAEALKFHSIWFEDIAITAKHFHVLAQFPPNRFTTSGKPILDPARHFIGIAKKESARALSGLGLRLPGATWAKRSHPEPIESEEHWTYVRDVYIPKHYHEGGAIYTIHIARSRSAPDQ
jgi:hypothetical protein